MKALDHSLFAKVVRMTESDHDGEALAAVRRANAMLKAAGLTWSDVLPAPKAEADPFTPAESNPWQPIRRPGEVRLGREHMVRAKMLLASGFPWDDWKADFLRSMAVRDAALTPGQRAKIGECEALAASWRAAA